MRCGTQLWLVAVVLAIGCAQDNNDASRTGSHRRRATRLQLTPFGNNGYRIESVPVLQTPRPSASTIGVVKAPHVTHDELALAIAVGTQSVNAMQRLEREILEKGLIEKATFDVHLQNSVSSRTSARAKKESVSALVSIEATKLLAERLGLDVNDVANLQLLNLTNTLLHDVCPYTAIIPPCVPERYRTADGYCNNAVNPRWGSSHVNLRRMAPPAYEDNVDFMRTRSVDGSLLPSPRVVSLGMHPTDSDLHGKVSVMVMQWGQFLDHDITHTPIMTDSNSQAIDCCQEDSALYTGCQPIVAPPDDPFYSEHRDFCINFARSTPAPRFGCALGHREQMNILTSFIDGSQVYGNTQSTADTLREGEGGRLKGKPHPAGSHYKHLLPSNKDNADCKRISKSDKCFLAGDDRVNEHVGLMSMHTVWMREHNRIVAELERLNPHWDDELLYQEARKIVGAELQHITFSEWLPIVLGREEMSRHAEDLSLAKDGYYDGYDINRDPGIYNEFATAAFRFGHTLIPSFLNRVDPPLTHAEPLLMRNAFFSPSTIYRTDATGGIDAILRGMCAQNVERADMKVTTEIRDHLFQEHGKRYGMDLISLNIQRGRDHGLPGYNTYRHMCGLPLAKNFNDLRDVMDEESIIGFKRIYSNVDDIDFFTAGLAERKLNGALLGPTFACIIGRQFTALRRGDRLWYENNDAVSRFSPEQLAEIRHVTLSSVLCNVADNITRAQPQIFLMPDMFTNDFVDCSHLPMVDLSKWEDTEYKMPIRLHSSQVAQSVKEAHSNVQNIVQLEKQAYELGFGRVLSPRDSLSRHASFMKSTPYIQLLSQASKVLINATGILVSLNSLTRADVLDRLASVSLPDNLIPPEPDACVASTPFIACDITSKFRTISARCNNLGDPEAGTALRPLTRVLPPAYDDGINAPHVAGNQGRRLPSARSVSLRIHEDISKSHLAYTLALMQWGQFADHDITHTPLSRGFNNSVLDCSNCNSFTTVSTECFPIEVPRDDPFFPITTPEGNRKCMGFARSSPISLRFGPRQQMNAITSYLDASNVYGSDTCRATLLREFRDGKLRTVPNSDGLKPLLPPHALDDDCKNEDKALCFLAGDLRANEQPMLSVMHLLWVREHNRITERLTNLNPHWSDNQLYEEGRRIVGAMHQHITYHEFLPRVLGVTTMDRYGLTLKSSGFYDGYDPSCDVTISNEFATAAFRFGHSLIKDVFKRFNTVFREKYAPVGLIFNFFNPEVLRDNTNGGVDSLIRGLITVVAESADRHLVKSITNHLFEERGKPFSGLDLGAMNIQRGRDHGLHGYNDYRESCGLHRARSFNDLSREISDSNVINKLSRTYETVDDIDLFTGGLAEDPMMGALIGPTFACIIAEQFQRLRKCDRFWYETGDHVTRFTSAQLTEIRKTTLAKMLCVNSDNIPVIHPYVMSLPDDVLNAPIACDTLDSVNLRHWREGAFCTGVGGSSGRVRAGTTQRISPCKACFCPSNGNTAICNTMKISNCYELLTQYSSDELNADDACVTQCAYVVRAFVIETPLTVGKGDSNFITQNREPFANAATGRGGRIGDGFSFSGGS
ncbi:PREDICTED: uncharacterized protein LOC106807453 [Priapulus caudatus]|uniref:Uncharacterized protein LOC106807453 n=1 Tax=Priapulus caudatus TaxID=37621 RepID=A0ABM1DZ99_PRICU|nr:PREDICTED: uncharacterized protein LOC106807453 [Priapulus caudatus]XP_014665279.1 PREDICTED: uncharacterized protein LOC106807453 [Priapulus caudatus]XP_014665284.1 PREDICTED: uncharacterized protein LOC106807453 [Priapulus caudatus]XP_014665290.1 PREDICTED: uncharacterized protein LOC106807453 [Priapulus caudatus]